MLIFYSKLFQELVSECHSTTHLLLCKYFAVCKDFSFHFYQKEPLGIQDVAI